MKTIKKARLLLFSLMVGSGAALAQNVDLHWTSPEKERYVTFYAEPQGKPPEEMSYMIAPVNPDPKFQTDWEKEAQTNHHLLPLNWDVGFNIFDEYKEAVWVPFKTNMLVDLGPGDGGRWLWVGFRMKGDEKPYRVGNGIATNIEGGNWDAHHIILQTLPPTVVITAPKPGITSQPMVQLKGYVTSDMDSVLRFDVFNQNGAVTGSGEAGFDNRSEDSDRWAYVENYFQCLDIQLSPGTNTIVLSGTDSAGFQFKTNFVCVFTTVGATNPPVFSVTWPQDGTSISGAQFDLYGRCDEDPTAVITGLLTDDEGKSSHLNGFVERNGCLWIERVPVENGKNYLTIVATDAANNS
ncbi:MAG TPA: hypothetical protein VNX46_08215, partial [Candidatus Acidoferrum sp.]|nr:hypothetical protein [Candidatus Acidoferrum sp.]